VTAAAIRQILDVCLQREDWTAALTYARALADVNSERIAVSGSSFGCDT
jgi:hypothetical protein